MSEQGQKQKLSQGRDMRYFPRWNVSGRVLYHVDWDKEPREGKAKDISCAGACIIGEKYIEPFQKIDLTVYLTEETKIKLNGHVQWVRSHDDSLQMGVIFYDTPDHVQELILQHAFEVDREQMIKQWFKGWDSA